MKYLINCAFASAAVFVFYVLVHLCIGFIKFEFVSVADWGEAWRFVFIIMSCGVFLCAYTIPGIFFRNEN